MNGFDELLARVTAQPARRAFEALYAEARQDGFDIGYKRSGHVPSVDLRLDGSHMFSWIPNRAHLLFYIRKPALAADATLAERAFANHPADAARNAAGEVTIRITDPAAAGALADWLFQCSEKRKAKETARGGHRSLSPPISILLGMPSALGATRLCRRQSNSVHADTGFRGRASHSSNDPI